MPPENDIVLFDGNCGVCSRTVQFIIRRDPEANFKFLALESPLASELLEKGKFSAETDSIVLINRDGHYEDRSDAVLSILSRLKGPSRFLSVFRFVPKYIRDFAYATFAKHRYKIFGENTACLLPSKELQDRFLLTF